MAGASTEPAPAPGAVPALGMAPPLVPARERRVRPSQPVRWTPPRRGLWWMTLAVAGVFCFITFYATGGLELETMTITEIVLTLTASVVVAGALVLAPAGRRAYGAWPLTLLLAFTALTAVSIVWSVQPDLSWQDAGRMLAYSAVFAAGLALVRIAPSRWPALLGGLTLAAAVVCAYALASKVFPSGTDKVARLNEPYGYWNAIGLTAAMGAVCCMWLGARRDGHALLRALAYPAMGVMLTTLLLAYSRGALAALAVGVVLWFAIVPLRLRGAAVLIAGAVGAGAVAAWDFSTSALSGEKVPYAERLTAGHQLGAILVAMVLVLAAAGVAIGFATGRRPPTAIARRRAGAALLALIVLAAIAFAGALAHSQRGFTGTISHSFSALTNPNAKPPPNTPGRLTAVASVRARYWKEALQVFSAHPALGAGAEGYATAHLRYRKETLTVRHAHGFVVQTLADLGLVGLVLALALMLTWLAAAGRATHPFGRSWSGWSAWLRIGRGERPGWRRLQAELPYTPERVALLSMLVVVVVFGAHSLIDWTWYVPGDACVALLLAGWLAGRGPLRETAAPRPAPATAPGASAPASAPMPASASASVSTPALAEENHRVAGWREAIGRGRGGDAIASPGYVRLGLAGAVVVLGLLAAWSQAQPLRSEEAAQEADVQLEAHDPTAAAASARSAIARDPLSAEALFTLAAVQRYEGATADARATLVRAVRLQPSNPKTWLELARNDLTSDPQAALGELEAVIYLNPEVIAPEEISPPYAQAESVEIYNDYVQALRASEAATAARLRSERASRARAAASARRARRRARERARARSRTREAAG